MLHSDTEAEKKRLLYIIKHIVGIEKSETTRNETHYVLFTYLVLFVSFIRDNKNLHFRQQFF